MAAGVRSYAAGMPFLLQFVDDLRDSLVDHLATCGLSHIVADFRLIIWRKLLRTLCQYSAMTQKVLPHNVAWPFFPFLPLWDCSRSAAILCGRKSPMALKVVPMLKERALTDKVALSVFSPIFLRTDTESCRKHVFVRSRHIMWQKRQVHAGETVTFCGYGLGHFQHTPWP